jgi:hypothetical protein
MTETSEQADALWLRDVACSAEHRRLIEARINAHFA